MPSHPPPAIYLTHVPAAPLNRFVERLWYWEGEPPPQARDRILPDGSAGLIINLAEDEVRAYEGPADALVQRYPGAVLVGAHSRYTVVDAQEQRAVIGVSFRPGGMWPFFEPAAEELHNQHVGLGDLWRSHGGSLRERILAAPTPRARLLMLENELLAHAIRPLQMRPEIGFALARLTNPPPTQSIATLSAEIGMSTRRLSRLFALEVGMTPKLYARIKRFERMLRGIAGDRPIDWVNVALDCGYFDQSHLIYDCQLIAGFSPGELRRRRGSDTHHVAL